MRGTLLNTATVAAGASIGLAVGKLIPGEYQSVALSGLGLVVTGIGIRMFLKSRNAIVVAVSVALGGVIGLALGLQHGLDVFAEWARTSLGGEKGSFNEGLITASVLFCVGPMTLLGCLQDGLEGKIELLALKSTLDGIVSVFFAAAMGAGVLVSAAVVLVVQGALTLLAHPLRGLAGDQELMNDTSSAGGVLLMGIGLGMLKILHLSMATYLPALILVPVFVIAGRKLSHKRSAMPPQL